MNSKLIAKGRWLALHEVDYQDSHGNSKSWECVRRINGNGAASIIATVENNGEAHLVVVKQFRPPVGASVLELPAGLIDSDESVATTALRELAEETGCIGEPIEVGPFVHNSPGLSDEKTAVVRISVDKIGLPAPDGDEAIEILFFPIRGLKLRLMEEADRTGVHLDAKLWCFALGLEFAQSSGIQNPDR